MWDMGLSAHCVLFMLLNSIGSLTYDLHQRLVPDSSVMRKDRRASPVPGGSTLITSAPKYASAAPQKFPATT